MEEKQVIIICRFKGKIFHSTNHLCIKSQLEKMDKHSQEKRMKT